MAQTRTTIRNWMHTKVCPSCGYHGRDVQSIGVLDQEAMDDEAYVCPCCGNDLYARPAMSYAEMEGFALDAEADEARGAGAPLERRVQDSTRVEVGRRRGVLSRAWMRVWVWLGRVVGVRG